MDILSLIWVVKRTLRWIPEIKGRAEKVTARYQLSDRNLSTYLLSCFIMIVPSSYLHAYPVMPDHDKLPKSNIVTP